MAEIYRHTDEDGDRAVVHTLFGGDLRIVVVDLDDSRRGGAVDIPEVDGRRLLANLQRHYALLDGQSEPAHGGTVATQEPAVPAEQPEPGCPTCHTILNAKTASCGDPWHADNRPAAEQPEGSDRSG
jgi:hypothetical protein